MALRKNVPAGSTALGAVRSLSFSCKEKGRSDVVDRQRSTEVDGDIDLREVYFLIMHFLSAGPCQRTYGQLWNELLEHQLLPRRYHAWHSRSAVHSGDENDDGLSFPLSYSKLVERYPHIEKDHLVKLLKQLLLGGTVPSQSLIGGNALNAAAVPTLLGTGSFSLLASDQRKMDTKDKQVPGYMRWPHRLADQVRGLSLREIGGGFPRHHRAPSTRAACYAIAKPSTMVQKMQHTTKVRGHRNAVYCATFDRSGRYVITGSDDRLVKVWSMETAYCLASCRGHEGDITDLTVNLNNTLVASASNDFVIRVWRLPDGLPISVLRGHTGAVTAIAFSPKPGSYYHLLSSSDDGTCRMWDARYSNLAQRIYIPKPSDAIAGRNNVPSSSAVQQTHQIFCCAFNASGTIFVSGSSDTLARVWNACKSSTDDSGQPSHEIDVLVGHENDVNYVQFSGCAVPVRSSPTDASKEDTLPKFKNTWFNHDNIVTCSRDGSAIIWTPRSRRPHGKTGRWVRAYHLKVPPPPMPPQPPRGGLRQRVLPTPRGVNMIAWSLDNRFVLAAIMDCRICVWNAVDGSLVHSLTGHTASTYVLDVHPFNPRIAMSAGYDGKIIVWDIWEGTPIWTFQIGTFQLVDGKFSPDGTSIILSDDVGELYILNTGQGEAHKDAKFDQFFLGDYRPLIHDTHGNVLDQETQLAPYRRNMQDLLCDSGMIPYPEPYQSMYQQRRLGALGIDWRPSPLRFAIGVDFSLDPDYHMLPIVDLDTLIDPLPEYANAIEWAPEIEIQSDDNDSEYHIAEDISSGGEQVSLSLDTGDFEYSSKGSDVEGLRRSRRMNKNTEVEIMASSGRSVKRKILGDVEDSSIRNNRTPSKNKRKGSKNKSSSKSRPRRAAARNALHFFSRIIGSDTKGDVNGSDSETPESGSLLQDSSSASEESDASLQDEWRESSKGKEIALDYYSVDGDRSHPYPESRPLVSTKRRLILRFPSRNSSKHVTSASEFNENHSDVAGSSSRVSHGNNLYNSGDEDNCVAPDDYSRGTNNAGEPDIGLLGGSTNGAIRWGGFKTRTPKKLKMVEEPVLVGLHGGSSSVLDARAENRNGHSSSAREHEMKSPSSEIQYHERICEENVGMDHNAATSTIPESRSHEVSDGTPVSHSPCANGAPKKLLIKCGTLSRGHDTNGKIIPKSTSGDMKNSSVCDNAGKQYSDSKEQNAVWVDGPSSRSGLEELLRKDSNNRMFTAVYRRSKSLRGRINVENERFNMEANSSNAETSNLGEAIETPPEGARRARSIRIRSNRRDGPIVFKETRHYLEVMSIDVEKTSPKGEDNSAEEWRSESRNSVRLRSTRKNRGSNVLQGRSPPDHRKCNNTGNSSWLLLTAHEEGSRYIPQRKDEVVYLRQGHQEYVSYSNSRYRGPWETIKRKIRAVEFCRVEELDYSTHSGSGESCCIVTLKFIDPSSEVFGKSFTFTLPELTGFPDFLVEKSWYDASVARNWTKRDRCQVWWKNEGDEDGSWWEGRISDVKPKCVEFPESPWERYIVQYRDEPSARHNHNPWELYDVDNTQWDQTHINDDVREKLQQAFAKLEQSGYKAQDIYGVNKLKQASQKTNFINRFPVPLSLEVIQSRLQNNYYRSLEAMKHDIEVMLSNAESYFGRNAELSAKMKRLSQWFHKMLPS